METLLAFKNKKLDFEKWKNQTGQNSVKPLKTSIWQGSLAP